MAAPKLTPDGLRKLFQEEEEEEEEERNQRDKKQVEALRSRLQERLTKDPGACKKAAVILESWINKKPKIKEDR